MSSWRCSCPKARRCGIRHGYYGQEKANIQACCDPFSTNKTRLISLQDYRFHLRKTFGGKTPSGHWPLTDMNTFWTAFSLFSHSNEDGLKVYPLSFFFFEYSVLISVMTSSSLRKNSRIIVWEGAFFNCFETYLFRENFGTFGTLKVWLGVNKKAVSTLLMPRLSAKTTRGPTGGKEISFHERVIISVTCVNGLWALTIFLCCWQVNLHLLQKWPGDN